MDYFLKYTIRDGETEYEDNALIKSKKPVSLKSENKVFKKFLEENYCEKVTESFDGFEIGSDYRIFELDGLIEITKDELKVIEKLVTSYTIEV